MTIKLKLLDDHVSGRDWMVGNQRTVLDAYVTPMLRWAVSMLPGGIAAFPALEAHYHKMHVDPAVRRVLVAEGLA